MRFNTPPAPHVAPTASTGHIMQIVLLAMLPGVGAQVWQFGPGVLIHLALAIATALLAESAVLRLRSQPSRAGLSDWSAVLTAALLAGSLPPIAPWWISVFGALFAIVIGKQIYGGLGYNPFNPAMVGYAVLLISFPKAMTAWLPPADVAATPLGLLDAWNAIARHAGPEGSSFDALAMATPLDTLKTQFSLGRTIDEIQAAPLFGTLAGKGWQWVNLGYLAGGLWLLRKGLIAWQIPAGFLAALSALSLGFFLLEPQTYPTPLFHLLGGATMLGAFFIATDPVTAATTPKGRLIYGALVGLLVFVIRAWGGYPDGVAFAVLLLNLAAPTIDHYTRPRVYGHPE